MKSIQEQIEALTQELRPYPTEVDSYFYAFGPDDYDGMVGVFTCVVNNHDVTKAIWRDALFVSTNKAEVEEYADCYRRLKLYQLIGEKKKKEFPLDFENADIIPLKGTDFGSGSGIDGYIEYTKYYKPTPCVLGGVWFANESDRLHALSICRIDRSFQEKCARFGLGGA